MVFGESFVNVVSVSLNHGPGLKVLIHFDGKKKNSAAIIETLFRPETLKNFPTKHTEWRK